MAIHLLEFVAKSTINWTNKYEAVSETTTTTMTTTTTATRRRRRGRRRRKEQ
jgi:hypothetical protein